MYLKSLELTGYKTFASKTSFEFAPRITAVVGPNGSGKSNIADALRWVLGEQSYSLLRGRKTEDMIYSGSQGRARAGMAAATVVFDNQDGWLPIDYTEVAITRRAYRDGQNEYLLNGQKIRLREISELLASSGLAERTYTIIGQGLVDRALALKAEDRRRLFEEAAGIRLYRSRREEALRRLEATHRNLQRVRDILAEIKPRLASLTRQAGRAQEYDQIKADLNALLREWYGFHWHRAQQSLKADREVARKQETELEAARRNLSQSGRKVAALRSQIQESRSSLNEWHRELSRIHARREQVSRQLAVLEERYRSLIGQGDALKQERLDLQENVQRQQARLDETKKSLERSRLQAEQAGEETRAAEQALLERQRARQQITTELTEIDAQIQEYSRRRVQDMARQQELEALRARRHEDLIGLQSRHLETEAESAFSRQELQRAQEHFRDLEEALGNIESQQTQTQDRLEALREARRQLLEHRSALQAEIARQRAQLEVLSEAEQAFEGYAEGVRFLMQAAGRGQIAGLRGALSPLLEVPAEYETAVSAALGEWLDGILVEPHASMADLLAYLETAPGRVALLPLQVESAPEPDSPSLPGLLGHAAALIGAPAELRPLLRVLLENTWVVTDRAVARKLLGQGLMGLDACLVTLKGEVFYAGGPVLSGKPGRAGRIGRSGKIRDIRSNLDVLQAKIEVQAGDVAAADNEIEGLGDTLAELDREMEQASQRLSAAREDLQRAESGWLEIGRKRDWQTEQMAALEMERKQAATAIQELAEEIAGLDVELQDLEARRKQTAERISALPEETLQRAVAHWRTELAVAEQGLAEAERRHQEIDQERERAAKRMQNHQSRIETLEAEIADQAVQRTALRDEEKKIADQISAMQAKIQPAESALETAEADLDARQALENQVRGRLTIAERHHSQAQIALIRTQESLETLRQRIEDDFGLVAFEYEEEVSGPTPLPLGEIVQELPAVREVNPEVGKTIKRLRAQLRRVGPVNPDARRELAELRARFDHMNAQLADLEQAEHGIRQVINELDTVMREAFLSTFEAAAAEFRSIFSRLFGGGSARLILTDGEDLTETGVEIEARLPGRRTQGLSLLSGGERSLTAAALIFALLKVSPTPFCVLDEVDAMLDEANIHRFRELLQELSQNTQFIVITHNRNTVQAADTIYGITMRSDLTSQVLGLKLGQVPDLVG